MSHNNFGGGGGGGGENKYFHRNKEAGEEIKKFFPSRKEIDQFLLCSSEGGETYTAFLTSQNILLLLS